MTKRLHPVASTLASALALPMLWLGAVAGGPTGGDAPPDPPAAAQTVGIGAQSSSSSSTSSQTPARSIEAERLPLGTLSREFHLGTQSELDADTLVEKLLEAEGEGPQRFDEALAEVQKQIEFDIAQLDRNLDNDNDTRTEVFKIDEKYRDLQVAGRLDRQDNPAATRLYFIPMALRYDIDAFFGDGSGENAMRYQFVTSLGESGPTHFGAGDVYADRERKTVSLVVWDSLHNYSFDQIVHHLKQAIPEGGRLVARQYMTDAQGIGNACLQCSMQFIDAMAGQDLHSRQIAALDAGIRHGSITPSGQRDDNDPGIYVDAAIVRTGDDDRRAAVPDDIVPLITSATTASGVVDAKIEEARKDTSLSDAERAARIAALENVRTGIRGNMTTVSSEGAGAARKNLEIDRRRVKALREISSRLSDPEAASGFLRAARDRSLERAYEAGRDQSTDVAAALPPEDDGSALPRRVSALPGDQANARSTGGGIDPASVVRFPEELPQPEDDRADNSAVPAEADAHDSTASIWDLLADLPDVPVDRTDRPAGRGGADEPPSGKDVKEPEGAGRE